jgi:hypothetical protein
VLSGGCLDLAEGSVPYLPLVDALHDLRPTRCLRCCALAPRRSRGVAAFRGCGTRPDLRGYLDVLRSASVTSPWR